MQDKKNVKPGEKNPPYDRTQYFQYAADPKAAFLKFYMFCFNLVKPPCVLPSSLFPCICPLNLFSQSKNIDMEVSRTTCLLPSPRTECRIDFCCVLVSSACAKVSHYARSA